MWLFPKSHRCTCPAPSAKGWMRSWSQGHLVGRGHCRKQLLGKEAPVAFQYETIPRPSIWDRCHYQSPHPACESADWPTSWMRSLRPRLLKWLQGKVWDGARAHMMLDTFYKLCNFGPVILFCEPQFLHLYNGDENVSSFRRSDGTALSDP